MNILSLSLLTFANTPLCRFSTTAKQIYDSSPQPQVSQLFSQTPKDPYSGRGLLNFHAPSIFHLTLLKPIHSRCRPLNQLQSQIGNPNRISMSKYQSIQVLRSLLLVLRLLLFFIGSSLNIHCTCLPKDLAQSIVFLMSSSHPSLLPLELLLEIRSHQVSMLAALLLSSRHLIRLELSFHLKSCL